MPITITFDGARYTAVVTPPHGRRGEWVTDAPMSAGDLAEVLTTEVGCHPNDVGDAFYRVDPGWVERTEN